MRNSGVAVATEKTPDFSGVVAVIQMKALQLSSGFCGTADRALLALFSQQTGVCSVRSAVERLEVDVVFVIRKFSFVTALVFRNALFVAVVPVLGYLKAFAGVLCVPASYLRQNLVLVSGFPFSRCLPSAALARIGVTEWLGSVSGKIRKGLRLATFVAFASVHVAQSNTEI